jgi:tubulin-like protein CetZ
LKPFIVGVGRAGSRIANIFFKNGGARTPYVGVILDTENANLHYFSHRYKLLLGEKFVDGNGTGGNLKLGKEIMDAEKYRIVEKMDTIKTDIDCIFVISALGGGTGGAVDVLMEELKKSYVEPVYYAGILPSEDDPEKAVMNFSDTFKSVVGSCDSIFPIDSDYMRKKRSLRGSLNRLNEMIFRHFSNLFDVGEYRSKEDLGGKIMGSTDAINTLGGVSSIGQETYELKGSMMSRRRERDLDKPELVVSMTENATTQTLLPFDVKDSKKALVIVSGPRKYLDFLGSIPARLWVEKNIGGIEVRGGDIPGFDKRDLEVTVVFSGIRKSARIRYLYQLGNMAKNRGIYSEKISRIFDKLKVLDSKISGIDEDFKTIYKDMKDIVDEPLDRLNGRENG